MARDREDAYSAWQRMIALGAMGRYLTAWQQSAALASRIEWASRRFSTYASHLRQVGAIAAAAEADRSALSEAHDAASRAEALIGLAADAIAARTPIAASEPLDEAERALAFVTSPDEGWRVATRLSWVRAEQALALGQPTHALTHAQSALDCCLGESERHRAKSHLILAAVAAANGQADTAWVNVDAGLAVARGHGWWTLLWPGALIALDLSEVRPRSVTGVQETIQRGLLATRIIEAHLPESLARQWRERADVVRLRRAGAG